MREFAKRMKLITKGYIDILNRIPAEPVVNERYTFRLDHAVSLRHRLASRDGRNEMDDHGKETEWRRDNLVNHV
ncbi:hypothetical protein [Serratia marcescens]|uniref:hypothetical protein n=1 Tax=Serratia marcescens TaxID=615 RepID=UPI0007620EC5|nr:hypothetical protein [Serratia marcescens]